MVHVQRIWMPWAHWLLRNKLFTFCRRSNMAAMSRDQLTIQECYAPVLICVHHCTMFEIGTLSRVQVLGRQKKCRRRRRWRRRKNRTKTIGAQAWAWAPNEKGQKTGERTVQKSWKNYWRLLITFSIMCTKVDTVAFLQVLQLNRNGYLIRCSK